MARKEREDHVVLVTTDDYLAFWPCGD